MDVETLRSLIRAELASGEPDPLAAPAPVTPAAISQEPMPEPASGLSPGVQWTLALGCLGAFVLACVKFGGRLGA
jgi:hypothetical protein